MEEINLVKRVREERVPERKAKKSWDEVVKQEIEACASMMPRQKQVEMMLQKSG